jgi:hypothetical protein
VKRGCDATAMSTNLSCSLIGWLQQVNKSESGKAYSRASEIGSLGFRPLPFPRPRVRDPQILYIEVSHFP